MVRPEIVSSARAKAVWGLVAALAAAGPSIGRAQNPATADRGALDALLARAQSTAPGTYVLAAGAADRVPDALPVLVQADVLRGADRTVRVPIVVAAEVPDPAEVRLRVVPATAGNAARRVEEAAGTGPAGRLRVVREFTLAPGEYEIQAVVGQKRTGGASTATLAKSRLTVPDVWAGGLAVTPLVLADSAGAQGPRSATEAFRFGPTVLTPAVTPRFPQHGAVSVAFRIFNWTARPGDTPDLSVEYVFHQQTAKRLAFFNKTKPQRLTAETLGDKFDPAAGAVTAGMTIPLASFPFGEFTLTVRVTDNRLHRTAARDVRFSVAP